MSIQTTYSRFLPEATVQSARAAIAARIGDISALTAITEADAALVARSGTWTRKQILGHLIDSALNNTQRFVRGEIPGHWTNGVLRLPRYLQDDWVRVSNYQARPWSEIISLWVAVNQHIVRVIENYDPAYLATPCAVGDEEPVSIEHLIVDYAGHLVHHYQQIF